MAAVAVGIRRGDNRAAGRDGNDANGDDHSSSRDVHATGGRSVVKPVIAKAVTVPSKLVAGKTVTVSFRVTRSDTGRLLTTGKMVCDPSVAGKVVRHAESFKGGIATLRFTVPKTAKGKLLKVHLTIKLNSQTGPASAPFTSARPDARNNA